MAVYTQQDINKMIHDWEANRGDISEGKRMYFNSLLGTVNPNAPKTLASWEQPFVSSGDDVSLPDNVRAQSVQENLASQQEMVQNPELRAQYGLTPKVGNIPSFDQWMAQNPNRRGDNSPWYDYLETHYNMPVSKGDFMERWGPALAMMAVPAAGAMGIGGGTSLATSLAATYPALQSVPYLSNAVAGSIISAASGGNPLTGAVTGSLFPAAGDALGAAGGGELLSGMDLAGDAPNLFTGNGALSGGAFDSLGQVVGAGVDMTGFTKPDPFSFPQQPSPFEVTDPLINAGQVMDPNAPLGLTEAMGGLPTPNLGQFGSVVDLANSGQNLPVNTSVMNGGNVGLLSNQIGGEPLGVIDQITKEVKNLLPGGAGTALKSLLGNGSGSGPNLGNILGGLLRGGLGYLGADKQAEAFQNVYNQQSAIGAPFRDRLNASYAPSFDLMSQPGYGDAFNRMAEISTNSWSPKGNPANSPGIQAGILNDVWAQNYLPALSNYRGQLGQFGGLGLNTAGQASLMGAQTAGGGLNAIGYGLNTAFQQPSPLDDYYKQAAERMRQQNEQYVKVGGQRYGG